MLTSITESTSEYIRNLANVASTQTMAIVNSKETSRESTIPKQKKLNQMMTTHTIHKSVSHSTTTFQEKLTNQYFQSENKPSNQIFSVQKTLSSQSFLSNMKHSMMTTPASQIISSNIHSVSNHSISAKISLTEILPHEKGPIRDQ